MIFIFIICGLIALLELAIVWRNQEDKDTMIFELELEIKMKDEIIDSLEDKYEKIYDSNYKLAEVIKKKIK